MGAADCFQVRPWMPWHPHPTVSSLHLLAIKMFTLQHAIIYSLQVPPGLRVSSLNFLQNQFIVLRLNI